MNGECVTLTIRANRVKAGEVVNVLGAQVPTWLPGGFGLFLAWKGEDGPGLGSYGAIWTDETCRQVILEIFPGAARDESSMPAGRWFLIYRGTCTFGPVRNVSCLTYHAQTNGDAVSLQLVDLSRLEASQIVAGIRVRTTR